MKMLRFFVWIHPVPGTGRLWRRCDILRDGEPERRAKGDEFPHFSQNFHTVGPSCPAADGGGHGRDECIRERRNGNGAPPGFIKTGRTCCRRSMGRWVMGYTLSCRDLGSNCDFVAEGKTEEELLKNASEHGRTVHGLTEIPEELKRKMRRLLREDRAA